MQDLPKYLKKIKDLVDDVKIQSGYGELDVKIKIKKGKPYYVTVIKKVDLEVLDD